VLGVLQQNDRQAVLAPTQPLSYATLNVTLGEAQARAKLLFLTASDSPLDCSVKG
jgi:hypothetical protein